MNSKTHRKIILYTIMLISSLFLLAVGIVMVTIVFTFPRLPDLNRITHYEPSMPMKIYSQDNVLIGEYGIEKRTFTKIEDFPDILKYAVLAAEDKRFYRHKGIDVTGIIRALISNFVSGEIGQGASTITQQVAKNFFLSNEKTYKRKFYEILLALKIEINLTKDEILELYFNQIYLGQKAYGFTAAAKAYFDKPVQSLTIAEAAMLAGLPKAPSAFNPIINPQRSRQRQLYVLANMLNEGWITRSKYDEAVNQVLVYKAEKNGAEKVDEDSLYVAEMVRKQLHDRYGDDIYRSGYRVYTTVTIKNQKAATQALRKTLLSNSPRDSFKGAEALYNLSRVKPDHLETTALNYLSAHHPVQGQIPAIVIAASPKKIKLLVENRKDPITLSGASLNFISKAINNKKMGNKRVTVGSVIRLYRSKDGWIITQPPSLEGSIISLDTRTGAIQAVVGGFDFFAKQFNRATQAYRQPGSTFKPFVYSGAIDRGYTTGTIINDAPTSFGRYSPKNAGGYSGPITLREAFYRSKNVPAVKVLNSIGLNYAHKYVQRFGFNRKNIPKDLTMVLGSGQATPLEMARGYAVFANGGFLIEPYVIDKIYNSKGQLIAQTKPLIAGINAPRTVDPRNAFIMYRLLQDVILYGTGKAAQAIGRSDVGGKTGTTNKQKDAWFVGFNTRVVTAVYIGYDRPRSMGSMGYGGKVALPVWINYMRVALKGLPVEQPKQPRDVNVMNGSYSIKGKKMIGIKLDRPLLPSNPPKKQTESDSTILDNLF